MVKKILIGAGAIGALMALIAAGKKGSGLLDAVKNLKFIPTNFSDFTSNGFQSVNFNVDLNVSNPTSHYLPITLNKLVVTDNGHPLAQAIPATKNLDLKAYSSTPIQLAIEIQLANLVGNIQNLLNFSMEGKELMIDVEVEGIEFTHNIDLNDRK